MSIRIRGKCPYAKECKYGNGCSFVKSFKDGATFDPVFKIRIINTEKQVRCYSYTPKSREDSNDKEDL